MALAGDQLFVPIRNAFQKHHWSIRDVHVQIVAAETGNQAGMIGAAAAAKQRSC
jgi:hypothetical protein